MPSALTSPLLSSGIGSFLGNLGSDIVGGIGDFGGFLEEVTGGLGDIFNAVQPGVELGLGIANAVSSGPGTGASPNRPIMNPASPAVIMRNPADPTVNPADQLFQQVGNPAVAPGGGMAFPTIQPTNSCSRRFPATVQMMTTTASGAPKVVTYKNMGAAVLFSGDFAAAKRVKRVAAKAKRRSGGR